MALKRAIFNKSCQSILLTGRGCIAVKIGGINVAAHQLLRKDHIADTDSRCQGLAEGVHIDHAFVGVHAPKCGNRPGTIAEFAVIIILYDIAFFFF